MTAPGRLVELLLGPARCARLLDGSPEQSEELARWYLPLRFRAAIGGDAAAAEVMAAWHRVVDSEKALAWWQRPGPEKPALSIALLRRAPVGVLRVALQGDHWRPVEDGEAGQPAIAWAELSAGGEVLDLLALDPTDPSQWRARSGLAAVLPCEAELCWIEAGATLRLYRHPLTWLAAGAPDHSLVVLDWSVAAALQLLERINLADLRVVCDDVTHMREVAALARPRRPSLLLAVERPAAKEAAA